MYRINSCCLSEYLNIAGLQQSWNNVLEVLEKCWIFFVYKTVGTLLDESSSHRHRIFFATGRYLSDNIFIHPTLNVYSPFHSLVKICNIMTLTEKKA